MKHGLWLFGNAIIVFLVCGMRPATSFAIQSDPIVLLIKLHGVLLTYLPAASLPTEEPQSTEEGGCPIEVLYPETGEGRRAFCFKFVPWAPLFIESLRHEKAAAIKIVFFSSSPSGLITQTLKSLRLSDQKTSFYEAADGRVLASAHVKALLGPDSREKRQALVALRGLTGLASADLERTLVLDLHDIKKPYRPTPHVLWVRHKGQALNAEALVRTRAILGRVLSLSAGGDPSPRGALAQLQAKRVPAWSYWSGDDPELDGGMVDDEPIFDSQQYNDRLDSSAAILKEGYLSLFEHSRSYRSERRVASPPPRLARHQRRPPPVRTQEAPARIVARRMGRPWHRVGLPPGPPPQAYQSPFDQMAVRSRSY